MSGQIDPAFVAGVMLLANIAKRAEEEGVSVETIMVSDLFRANEALADRIKELETDKELDRLAREQLTRERDELRAKIEATP